MRFPASEMLEIIRLVEQSHLPARRTLEKLGVARATFYRVLAETRSDRWCLVKRSGFGVRGC
jgi:predicted DNA-binding protein (UPF0251 family)